jgi:hypothetical protein
MRWKGVVWRLETPGHTQMRARLQHRDRSIGIAVVANHKRQGRCVTDYVGWLGQVALPGSPEDRRRFWLKLDRRLKEIAASEPRLTAEVIKKLRASIEARLPPVKVPAHSSVLRKGERRVSA